MARCLTTRQLNALRVALDKRHISVDDVAGLDYRALARMPGLGHKGIANIRTWLAEHGRRLSNDEGGAADAHDTEREETLRRIRRAIACLQDQGYTVLPPGRGEA